MKAIAIFGLVLVFVTSRVLAADPPTAASAMDHSQMDMAHMDHAGHAMVAKGGEFTALDTNKDGKLSQGEMPKNHRLASHFDMLDVNRDGTLSAAEFAAGQQM
jgi:hypothetical protein